MKSDAQIQEDVMEQLQWNPFLKSAGIGVSVKNGVVTLSGIVDSYTHKIEAERSAKKVNGVRAIAEDIQVGVSPSYRKTDAEIAEAVLSAIRWHTAVPEEKIKVKVDNGMVTLEGEVDWEYQRSTAKNAICNLTGVRDVLNLVAVKPKASVMDIKRKISAALHRTATIDADHISVEVDGNKAILKGKVRSYAEKEDAEEAVWAAPGIASLESYLEIVPEETYSF